MALCIIILGVGYEPFHVIYASHSHQNVSNLNSDPDFVNLILVETVWKSIRFCSASTRDSATWYGADQSWWFGFSIDHSVECVYFEGQTWSMRLLKRVLNYIYFGGYEYRVCDGTTWYGADQSLEFGFSIDHSVEFVYFEGQTWSMRVLKRALNYMHFGGYE